MERDKPKDLPSSRPLTVLKERQHLTFSSKPAKTPVTPTSAKYHPRHRIKCGLPFSERGVADGGLSTPIKADGLRKITPGEKKLTTPRTLKLAPAVNQLDVSRLHEHLRAQNDIVILREQLADQQTEVKQLREDLKGKDVEIKLLEKENTKMASQLAQFKTEVSLLNGLLEDETQCRFQSESEAKEQQITLKSEHEIHLTNLQSEMSIKDQVITTKAHLISQQEQSLRELNKEIELLKVNNSTLQEESLHLTSNSKNCRGSISSMQANLTKKLQQVECRFKTSEERHRLQFEEAELKHLAEVSRLDALISYKETKIEELSGRLLESRQASEHSSLELLEYKSRDAKMEIKTQNLLLDLENMNTKVRSLEQQQEMEAEYSVQVQVLEGQLEQTLKMNHDLVTKLEATKQELNELRKCLVKKDSCCTELTLKLDIAEGQKQELLKFQPQQNLDIIINDTAQSMTDELSTEESKLAETLKDQEMKISTLESQLAESTRNYGLCKVDIRILRIENKKESDRNARLMENNSALLKENDAKCDELKTLTKQIEEFREQIWDLQKLLAQKELELTQTTQDSKEKLHLFEAENLQLANGYQEKMRNEEVLNVSLKKVEDELRAKIILLDEAQCRIATQCVSLTVLREACDVLDQQLIEFESTYATRICEVEELRSTNRFLEVQTLSLQDYVEKTKSELSECNARQLISETNAVNTAKMQEKMFTKEIKSLQQKLREVTSENSNLMDKIRQLVKQLDESYLERLRSQALYQTLEKDKDACSQELVVLSCKNAGLVKQNELLHIDLAESTENGEDLKNRYEALYSHQELVDNEIVERNVQLKSTIRQQAKLIEYLQQQNELLLKKKEKKFHVFSKSHRDENMTPTKSSDFPIWPANSQPTPSLTPVNLIREHFDMQRLETTVDSLKAKLAVLQENSQKCHAGNIPVAKKEDCILLKDQIS